MSSGVESRVTGSTGRSIMEIKEENSEEGDGPHPETPSAKLKAVQEVLRL